MEDLDSADVRGLQALLALGHVEGNLLTFSERTETVSLDFGEMSEQVFAAIVLGDEAEALGVVEPLYRSGSHEFYYLFQTMIGRCPGSAEQDRR